MRKFKHKGCKSVVAEYIGRRHMDGMAMRSKEWLVNGEVPDYLSVREAICPDCGERFEVCRENLEEKE